MSTDSDSFVNRGEYLSAYYFAEQLSADLKKGLFATWTLREGDENDARKTPREQVRALRSAYLAEDMRAYFADAAQRDAGDEAGLHTHNNPEWAKRLAEWHQTVLRALGYDVAPSELTVHRAGSEHTMSVAYHGHGIIALDCGWAADNDTALGADGSGRLLAPLRVSASESYKTGEDLASWLFESELGEPGGAHPRFVLLLIGGVILLADRQSWREGRYLAVSLDAALERNDRSQQGELSTIAALFSLDMLRPGDNDQNRAIDGLLKSSSTNAVGVSNELRYGLQRSVEVIANEVLSRMTEPKNQVTPADIENPKIRFARELTRESLRYLYRILFLLYAEARPELGILPSDDGSYEAGYSMARLRELVERDEELVDEEAKNGFHLFQSLDVLFNKVNFGHRAYGTEPYDDQPGDDEEAREAKAARRSEDRGLRFEPLRSELFEPTAIRLIGTRVLDPTSDEDTDPRWLDLRLRNSTLHEVLRLLTMKKGKRGERGGFISYRNLGINQLGAVYEGLMSYTGIIAEEELCEVAKGGDPEKGSWLIPSHKQDQYPDTTLIHYSEDDARKGLRGVKKYEKGSFVYRLAGRDRETSASYYTPESLTQVTVELALKNRLDQERDSNGNVIKTRASALLKYKICEPALGSGAFLNEAINQVANEYLRRRQDELGTTIPTADALIEKQRAKAYIALHNAYGVDLNSTGVELAEVSLWLNTMHPGMRAPWFGLHLRRGNSLIGARRAVYSGEDITSPAKTWLKNKGALAPTPLPFLKGGQTQPLPQDAVHQFLLPSPGWAAIAGSKEAKELAEDQAKQLVEWKKGILQRPRRSTAHLNKDGSPKLHPKSKQPRAEPPSQFTRLRDATRRTEFLWSVVIKRMELSEQEIARRINVWQADPTDPEYAFLQHPDQAVSKEKVLQDLFSAADTPYWRLKKVMDAWCALWFWPPDKAGLLDGSDGDYEARMVVSGADSLSKLLSGVPMAGERPQVQVAPKPSATPTPKAEPRFVEATALFPLRSEQTSFEDLELTVDDEVVVETKRVGVAPGKNSAPRPKTASRRPIIPLKELDDWLDFLEAMLGTADVPEGTLIDSFKSLDALKDFEETLPGFMGMDTSNPEDRFPWVRAVRDIAEEQGFLHWELEFALVFARDGGFDLQVGNPPWVRPVWKENSVLAEHEPWFMLAEKPPTTERDTRRAFEYTKEEVRDYILGELTKTVTTADYLTAPQVYPLLAGTQANLYRAFMCRVWQHLGSNGVAGLLHPDTHLEGVKEGKLRATSYRHLRLHASFVNSANWAFDDVDRTVSFGMHIYGKERKRVDFLNLSQLRAARVLPDSLAHDGEGDVPVQKYAGAWDVRPHRARIIHVTDELLSEWRKLGGDTDSATDETQLLYPVTTIEQEAISTLGNLKRRIGHHNPLISSGYHEATGKTDGTIRYEVHAPDSWGEVVIQGPHLGVGSLFGKQPNLPMRNVKDWSPWDIPSLPDDSIPRTTYARACSKQQYLERQDQWLGRPYSAYFRLAWRAMIDSKNTERSLFSAIIPPGPTHVHAVHSLALEDNLTTTLNAGFWSSLPLDYFLRITGRSHLQFAEVQKMPAAFASHPLAEPLLLRTLRLACITGEFAPLWSELFRREWADREKWAAIWPLLEGTLSAGISGEWTQRTPLRTEYERRAALVELDALVAAWLGITADQLTAIYRSRYSILADREAEMWFDAKGRRLAQDPYAFGYGQAKEDYAHIQSHLANPHRAPIPEGYTAPFYKADREKEMRAAHAVFVKQLNDAVARGEWDPVKQEVPKP